MIPEPNCKDFLDPSTSLLGLLGVETFAAGVEVQCVSLCFANWA